MPKTLKSTMRRARTKPTRFAREVLVVQSGNQGGGSGNPSGSIALETPTGDVDGDNDTFTFSGPPVLVFRNGVMEKRLGTVDGNDFVFDTAPETGDDIEGVV